MLLNGHGEAARVLVGLPRRSRPPPEARGSRWCEPYGRNDTELLANARPRRVARRDRAATARRREQPAEELGRQVRRNMRLLVNNERVPRCDNRGAMFVLPSFAARRGVLFEPRQRHLVHFT